MPARSPSPELDVERAHLTRSRAQLRRMRERADSLEAAGGNAVSTQYLAASLYRRRMSLVDDPSTPLFFGRIDLAEPPERFYVGRRHVQDERGDPMVIDWRAEISRAFYRASGADPMNLALRRRFGFAGGTLTAFEDETFAGPDAATGGAEPQSQILKDEIERPRVGPMRDIVATIQPDQDEIVRADLGETLCIQGGPGTGKTAVGLHRAAYLLYAHRARLRTGGVLVVGPNSAFLHYIDQVLPALGEVEVVQRTVAELVGRVPVRGADSVAVQRLKGDPRMAQVLRAAVWGHARPAAEPLVVPRGSMRLRLFPEDLDELRAALIARGLRYTASRAAFATMLASALTAQVEARGEPADDRTVAAFARCAPVRACVNAMWPALDPAAVVFALLTDPVHLATAADGLLSDVEQQLLAWPAAPRSPRSPRSPRAARWSASDAVLIDEVADLLERTPSYGHVVLDEAQDLSPMQCRAVGRRCSTGSATVLGDLAQGTSATVTGSWRETLRHMEKPDGVVRELQRGYRVPRDIVEFAARLLPVAAPGVAAPVSVRTAQGALRLQHVPARELLAASVEACRVALELPGSVGVVVADASAGKAQRALRAHDVACASLDIETTGADERVTVVPATLAKGLEFDHVVLVEPADVVAAAAADGLDEADATRAGLRLLYVALTRAVTSLVVLHASPLPAVLAG